jgi:hypothetical protein
MLRLKLVGLVAGTVGLLVSAPGASTPKLEKCHARRGVEPTQLLQDPAPPGSGARSPCARPPVAVVSPQPNLPPPATPQPAVGRGFFGLPLLGVLGGLGAAGLAAGGGNGAAATP